MKLPGRSGSGFFDLHVNAEVMKSAKESLGQMLFVALLEVLTAQLLKLGAVAEHGVDISEHGGRDGEDRLLGAAPALEAQELRVKIAVLLPRGGPGRLHQRGFEPRRARARAGGSPFSGALIQP